MKKKIITTSGGAVIWGLCYGIGSFLSMISMCCFFMRKKSWDLNGDVAFYAFRKSYLISGFHLLAYFSSYVYLTNGPVVCDWYIKILITFGLLVFLWTTITNLDRELFYESKLYFWTYYFLPNAGVSRLLVQRLVERRGRVEFLATICLVWLMGSCLFFLCFYFFTKQRHPKTKVIDESIDALSRILFVLVIFSFVWCGPRPPSSGPPVSPNAGELAIIRHSDLEEEDWDLDEGLVVI